MHYVLGFPKRLRTNVDELETPPIKVFVTAYVFLRPTIMGSETENKNRFSLWWC